jgi:hypothetical protein
MRSGFFSLLKAVAMQFVMLCLTLLSLAGQTTQQTGAKPALPRMADGHPDLQGTYDLSTMTPMERQAGDPPFLTKEQAEALQKAETTRRAKDNGLTTSEPKSFFEVLEQRGGGPVGGYNRLWLDQGSKYTVVDGQIRTSLIVDPPDGHVPPYNAAGRKRLSSVPPTPTAETRESQDVKAEPPGDFDNPEQRPLGERCILGFGSTSGPPALPDYFYNDLHQIVQTPDSIMILSEMVHDARIVRMNAQHLPSSIRRWMGDSVGHWENDTLVIDTTNFTDKTRFRGSTENLHVVERLRRVDEKTLLYRFTVEDRETWDGAWTGEYTWPATDKPIYEYACHEGNYALGDVLRGARRQEAQAAAAKAKQ